MFGASSLSLLCGGGGQRARAVTTQALSLGSKFFRPAAAQSSQPQPCHTLRNRPSLSRSYSSIEIEKKNVRNIEIPVPWGVLACQLWGKEDGKPMICIHGWKDNSSTFDRLLPLIQPHLQHYTILAVDMPGHGLSSHFPPGMIYQMVDMLVVITRIRKHFGWGKITLMGHSFGAITCFLYAGTHQHIVDHYIALDAMTPMILSKGDMLAMIPKIIHDTLNFEDKLKNRKVPSHTYLEALDKVMHGNVGALDATSCKVLMSRGMVEDPPGSERFRFTHDIRVHYLPMMTLSSNQVAFVAKNFSSNILHIKADPGVAYERPYVIDRIKRWLTVEAPGQKGKDVRFKQVEGNHHVHLTTPELIAPLVLDFLRAQK